MHFDWIAKMEFNEFIVLIPSRFTHHNYDAPVQKHSSKSTNFLEKCTESNFDVACMRHAHDYVKNNIHTHTHADTHVGSFAYSLFRCCDVHKYFHG